MTGRLTLYLPLVDGTDPRWAGIVSELWVRTLTTAAPPLITDEVELYPGEEGDTGVLWPVRRRWLGFDGGWAAELTYLVIDPTDAAHKRIREYTLSELGPEGPRYQSWSLDSDGDLRPQLEAAGWITNEQHRAYQAAARS